jgi:hypothetical protein
MQPQSAGIIAALETPRGQVPETIIANVSKRSTRQRSTRDVMWGAA